MLPAADRLQRPASVLNPNLTIYTSYFAVAHKLPATIVPISIARGTPRWLPNLRRYEPLFPTGTILQEYKTTQNPNKVDAYRERYFADVLDPLDRQTVIAELAALAAPPNEVALLCYERPVDFCHRHLVAEWLNSMKDLNLAPVQEYFFAGR